MRTCILGGALLAFAAWASAPGLAAGQQALASGLSQQRLARVTAVLDTYIAKGEIAGSVTLIHRHGQVAYVAARGVQDVVTKAPMRRDTIFLLASMTKPITNVATMMLVEEGKLSMDAPVEQWLPELANRRVLLSPTGPLDQTRPAPRPITVRDLLMYRAGYGGPQYAGIPSDAPIARAFAAVNAPGLTADEFMQRLGALPLIDAPGGRFLYSTPSTILGVLIARVSGMPHEQFFETRIFKPLGMTNTAYWVPPAKQSRLATSYELKAGKLTPSARGLPWDKPPVFANAAGGLFSTADDYLKFARLLLGKGEVDGVRLLSRRSVALMTRDYLPGRAAIKEDRDFAEAGLGFGLRIETRQDDLGPSPGSFSWGGSTGVAWLADPKEDMIYVRLIQRYGPPASFNTDFNTAVYQAIVD